MAIFEPRSHGFAWVTNWVSKGAKLYVFKSSQFSEHLKSHSVFKSIGWVTWLLPVAGSPGKTQGQVQTGFEQKHKSLCETLPFSVWTWCILIHSWSKWIKMLLSSQVSGCWSCLLPWGNETTFLGKLIVNTIPASFIPRRILSTLAESLGWVGSMESSAQVLAPEPPPERKDCPQDRQDFCTEWFLLIPSVRYLYLRLIISYYPQCNYSSMMQLAARRLLLCSISITFSSYVCLLLAWGQWRCSSRC